MKNLVLVGVMACALCTTVVASDIAFYVGAPNTDGWYSVDQMTTDVATIIDQTGHLFADIQQFGDDQFDAFGAWVDENTDDGELDILWLNGCVPSVLYPFPNSEPDGSRIEEWLDGGNMVINVGDWFGYVSYEGGSRQTANAGAGAANILDLASGIIAGGASGTMTVTELGQQYLPSLNGVAVERPVVLAEVQAPWEVAAVFGQNAAGTHADPVMLYNTETGGYFAAVNQATTWIDNRGLTCAELIGNWVQDVVGLADPAAAGNAMPEDEEMDVLRDIVLTWAPGQYPGTHDVYFGSSFEDVNGATVPMAANLDVNSFAPGRLEFGQTYFWRVDEVNTSPDKTVHRGAVWSFEVEPYSYQIPGSTIAVTASSSSNEFSIPEKMVDGSGLDGDTHSTDSLAMWFSAAVDLDPWIQFEFEDVYKMDVMKAWNANSVAESAIGWSVKDVEIQTSTDGQTWDVLPGPHQLSRGTGLPTYNQFDTVPLQGVAAKYIRLKIQSNWGGLVMSYGLSEVQFMRIPAAARTPEPESGSVDVLPSTTLKWRAGREADQHVVIIGTDANAVIDGTAPSVTATTNSLSLSDIDAELGQTYYWRVDEVNDAEAISVWGGPVWNFSTSIALVVDDFESYGNLSPDRPFQTWLDGYGYSADEFYPAGYGGNGTGSGVGHDIWSLNSPYFDGTIMETARTMAGSVQSMPFYYSNTGGAASQIDRTFAVPQDWTSGGTKTLSIGVFGQADNTGTLYVKINNVKKQFDGDITLNIWQPWEIDLASLGTNLSNVTTMSIGVDGNAASGMVLIDDILVYRVAPEPPETVSLVNDFDSLPVGSGMHDVDGWEGWFGDAQYDGEVTDAIAYSGTHALEIKGGRDDLVPHWPLVDSGLYEASIMQYVPSSTTSGIMFFAPLRIYGANWDETAWMKDLRTDCATGLVFVNDLDAGSRTEAPLIRDQWVQLRLVLNFDADTCDFYYGETHLGTTECPSIQAFDIYPDNDVDVVYFDDFRFESQL